MVYLEEINGPFYYNSLKNNIILMKNNQKWYIVDMDLHKLKVVNYYYFNLENSNSYTPPSEGWSSPETFIGKLPTPVVEETDINTLRQPTNLLENSLRVSLMKKLLKSYLKNNDTHGNITTIVLISILTINPDIELLTILSVIIGTDIKLPVLLLKNFNTL